MNQLSSLYPVIHTKVWYLASSLRHYSFESVYWLNWFWITNKILNSSYLDDWINLNYSLNLLNLNHSLNLLRCTTLCNIFLIIVYQLEEYIDHYNIDLIKVVSSYRASPLLPILKELSKAFNWFNFLSILQMLPLYTKYREVWLISWWCSIGVTSPIGCMLLFQRCKLQGGCLCEIK